MMIQYFSSLTSDVWFPSAIDVVAKFSLLLLFASIASWLLRGCSAALRHRIWTFALGGCVAIPAIAMIGPQLQIPLLRANPVVQESSFSSSLTLNRAECYAVGSGVASTTPTPSVRDSDTALSSGVSPELNAMFCCPSPENAEVLTPSSSAAEVASVLEVFSWQQSLLTVWLTGCVLLLIRLCSAVLVQVQCIRGMSEIDDVNWKTSVAAIAKQLGVTRSFLTLQSPMAGVPMTYGVFRSVIVVPAGWSKWSDEHRDCVLSHELAHVQRCDVAIQLFSRIIATIYWFNPLVWFAVCRLRVEREFACDDAVLLSGQRPSDYADALLTTLRNYRQTRFGLGVAMADSARLDCRVAAILDKKRLRHPPGRATTLLVIVFGVFCVSLIGAATLTAVAVQTQPVVQTEPANDEAVPAASPEKALSKSITIRGVVLGPDDRPIAGAKLYVNVKEYQHSIILGTSGPDGSFQFEVPRETLTRMVSPGVFLGQCKASLVAIADGVGAAWEFLPSEDGGRYGDMKSEYEVRLQMVEDLPVHGRIVDEAGEPVVGAVVSVDSIHELRGKTWYKMGPAIEALDVDSIPQQEIDVNNWSSFQYPAGGFGLIQATTDHSGNYTLTGLGSNRAVRLVVSGPGIKSPPTFSVLVRKDASEFAQLVREKYPPHGTGYGVRLFGIDSTIAVQRARTVAGTVRDAMSGEPVENAEVYVMGGTRDYTDPQCRVWTDSGGKFRLVRTREETDFTVMVDGDKHRYLPASRTFKNVTDIGETTADFEIPRGVLIRGKVVEANTDRPIASEHRDFCDDIQPGPLYAGYAKYYPIKDNHWLNDLGQGLNSIPFSYSQSNHIRWVHIDAKGEFQMSVPPGRGIVLIEARPPRDTMIGSPIPKVPYLTIGGDVTGTKNFWLENPKPAELTFPGMQKPIEADDFHTYKLIDPANVSDQLDLRFEVQPVPSQAVRFVDPNGNPIKGVKVAGLVPRADLGDTHVREVEDSNAAVYFDMRNSAPRRIVGISDDGKFGVSTSITATGESPLMIKMQPTASIKFQLIDKDMGKPAFGYWFRLLYGKSSTTAQELSMTAADELKKDKNGEFTITSIIADEPVSLTLIPPQGLKIPPHELASLTLKSGEIKNIGTLHTEKIDEQK